jgi:hypothetical protein
MLAGFAPITFGKPNYITVIIASNMIKGLHFPLFYLLGGDFLNKWYRSVIKIQIQNSIIDQFAKRRGENGGGTNNIHPKELQNRFS